jgi:CRP-like cAMP-binding protein
MSVAKKLAKKSIDEKLLKKLVPLNALSADRLRELADKADIESASPGRTLFKRGDTDVKTYYLLSGELEVQLAGGQNVSIKADTPAALHPLLDARPRPATAVIKSHATLLVIDSGLLDILVNYDSQQRYEVNEIQAQDESDWLTRFLQSLSTMNIPVKNIEHLIRRMQELPVRAGEAVIRQTDPDPQHYYVVKEGRCVVTKHATTTDKTPIRIAELTAGIGFGEEALLADQPRSANVTMLTDGRLMRLAKADFTQLIADPALHYVSYPQAQQMVKAGAVWLDTRSTAEHRDHTFIGSTHIPLMLLRTKVKELNAYGKYIAFCDTGSRAAATAFLLRQMGFSAYVLTDGLRDVPASALHHNTSAHATKSNEPPPLAPIPAPQADSSVRKATEELKLRPQPADTVSNAARLAEEARVQAAQAEVAQLRVQLTTARASEQDALQKLAQQATIARELDALKTEHARRQLSISELETQRATAEQALTNHQIRVCDLQAQLDEYKLNITAADAAYDSAQKELDGLSHTHARVSEELRYDNTRLQKQVAAKISEIEHIKTELERAVERNRTAEETLSSAEIEIARLQAEADAAKRSADDSLRRANESESLQATILKEVQRKIEAADLMRLEAEEQAQRAHEAAALSRKRAEQESRKVAEAEAARAKAQEESERRARLTDEIRNKADEEMARLKKEADVARASAEESQKKSQIADAARRRLELELRTQQAQARVQSVPAAKPVASTTAAATTPTVENDLDELERELAQLQKKLESKKRAAVARNEQVHAAEEKNRLAEPEIVQNVYDLHQKTQKLPVFKPNQASPNDVGKVRKSGWISDSILWETTIGLREDSEAEKFLDNENVQRAATAAATVKQQEASARAVSSGELKPKETKRSVFTTRESAPTIQRHVDVSGRSPHYIGLIAVVSLAVVAAGIGAYVMMQKTGASTPKATMSTPNLVAPDDLTSSPAASTSQINAPAATSKSTTLTNGSNGAITRKDAALPNTATDSVVAKPKVESAKLPARKSIPASQPLTDAPAVLPSQAPTAPEHDISTTSQESAAPAHTAPPLMNIAPGTADERGEHTQPFAEPAEVAPVPVVPSFTDAPRVN